MASIRIGVDVGGTFTEFTLRGGAGRARFLKIPSTPDDPARGSADRGGRCLPAPRLSQPRPRATIGQVLRAALPGLFVTSSAEVNPELREYERCSLAGYETLRRLASSPAHIIPGHDVQVMARYPVALEDIAWRVDLPPIT